MPQKLPVVAAIPNYNMAKQLKHLLPQVLRQNYDHIYVLDDASTDNSKQIVAEFGQKVTFVAGKPNLGAGGNRNRILHVLKNEAIIHFIDADCELASNNIPEVIREQIDPDIGLLGGLIIDSKGNQSIWNYGPGLSLFSWLSARLHFVLTRKGKNVTLRKMLGYFLEPWPDPDKKPLTRTTYWVAEANMAIRRSALSDAGGFDEAIREHDIQWPSICLQKAGYKATFSSDFVIRHRGNSNVRDYNRYGEMRRSEKYLIKKVGLKNWLLPGKHFKPRNND